MDLSDLRAEASDPEGHLEIKTETDARVVFADTAGYELNEWADSLAISRSELSGRMHKLARDTYQANEAGDPWAVHDPPVIAKVA